MAASHAGRIRSALERYRLEQPILESARRLGKQGAIRGCVHSPGGYFVRNRKCDDDRDYNKRRRIVQASGDEFLRPTANSCSIYAVMNGTTPGVWTTIPAASLQKPITIPGVCANS